MIILLTLKLRYSGVSLFRSPTPLHIHFVSFEVNSTSSDLPSRYAYTLANVRLHMQHVVNYSTTCSMN